MSLIFNQIQAKFEINIQNNRDLNWLKYVIGQKFESKYRLRSLIRFLTIHIHYTHQTSNNPKIPIIHHKPTHKTFTSYLIKFCQEVQCIQWSLIVGVGWLLSPVNSGQERLLDLINRTNQHVRKLLAAIEIQGRQDASGNPTPNTLYWTETQQQLKYLKVRNISVKSQITVNE